MKNSKFLNEKQKAIQSKSRRDNNATDKWLRKNGINPQFVGSTDTKLLKAQQEAQILLTNYRHLLTNSQIKKLNNFKRKMNTNEIRVQMKPDAANKVFNISTKIVRTLHRQQQVN